jgi:hypothetical protein
VGDSFAQHFDAHDPEAAALVGIPGIKVSSGLQRQHSNLQADNRILTVLGCASWHA